MANEVDQQQSTRGDRAESVSLKEHLLALRAADQRAIEIKETADAKALDLARQIQIYKDEKANELRAQIESERGNYATRVDLSALAEKTSLEIANLGIRFDEAMKPIAAFMVSATASSTTREREQSALKGNINTRLVVYGLVISAVVVLVNIITVTGHF